MPSPAPSSAAASRKSALKIGKAAFLVSVGILLAMILISGFLTLILPPGEYDRVKQDGRTLVVNGSYREIDRPDYPAWRWLTAPVEILFAPGNAALITIILFILSVGGSIAILERAGVMEDLVRRLVVRFATRKYTLLAIVIFFFMALASFIGVYEGMVPMIIFVVPLAISLGWDSLTGLGMSLLALSFGFSAAVTNPFTVAVAQRVADLPLFSGSWLRIIIFVTVYLLVTFFVMRHAKRVEANPRLSPTFAEDEEIRSRLASEAGGPNAAVSTAAENRSRGRALIWFGVCICIAMTIVVVTARLPGLSDLAFPVMGLLFLVGGIGSGVLAGLKGSEVAKAFGGGALDLIPGVALICLAYSVKHVIVSGKIMDTILFTAANLISDSAPMAAAFLVYATTLVLEFFIGSASAKALLMMPILAPLADLVGITRQTTVLAFDFGDGFSNMLFPTNALLLVALSFTVVSFPKWVAWIWKLQAAMFVLTVGFIALAVAIGFGPF